MKIVKYRFTYRHVVNAVWYETVSDVHGYSQRTSMLSRQPEDRDGRSQQRLDVIGQPWENQVGMSIYILWTGLTV